MDIIDLGAGDADLPAPPSVVEALRQAAEDPVNSRYPFQLGVPEFREAVARWVQGRFGITVDPFREVLPLIGSKEGIAHLPLMVLNPGDWAVVPDPGYQAYAGGVTLARGRVHPVPLRAENGFLLDLDEIPREILRRTRLLFLNYPNNPTSAVAPRSYLEEVVAFCRRHRILLAFDNAYSEVAFDGYRPPSILEIPGAGEVAIEFHSFSKTYNMTGWRLGWAMGESGIIAGLSKVKSFMDTGIFRAVQWAGVAALESHASWLPGNLETFRARRDAGVEALAALGVGIEPPRATMYLWIPVPGDEPVSDFSRRVLEETGVITLPGSALGSAGEGFVRLALTVSAGRMREAVDRIGRCLPGVTP